jgi:dihydrolipoamide dehydrogenase
MIETTSTKVLVVGGGPGGYVAAIRAGQLGLDTTLVEGDRLGGTCLIRGCIPSKALIHIAGECETLTRAATSGGWGGLSVAAPPKVNFPDIVQRKESVVRQLSAGVAALLKRAKVKVVTGWATFSDAKTCRVETEAGPQQIVAEHVILANGSIPAELPGLPFGDPVISSSDALTLEALPERLVVVGAGYIGLELGTAFAKLGSKVAIVEVRDHILPVYDKALTEPVKRRLERAGIELHLGAKAKRLDRAAGGNGLFIETAEGESVRLPADKILVTVGRLPRTGGWGLENMGLDMDGRFVRVDGQCRTAMRNVWAIGDLVGEPMLAHKASAQGAMVAEIIAGGVHRFEPAAIAAVCFTDPEIVSVGALPDDPNLPPDEVVTSVFPFQASGRALSVGAGEDGGFVRIVARKDDHRILGVQAVGPHVSELSGEFALALEMGAILEDIAGVIHVHPTFSEGFHEAALRALGRAIHI